MFRIAIIYTCHQRSNELMYFLCLFWCCSPACTYCPNRFVSYNTITKAIFILFAYCQQLVCYYLFCLSLITLIQRFADTKNRYHTMIFYMVEFLRYKIFILVKTMSSLRMTDQNIAAVKIV